jgi:hypothetical protein
VRLKENMGIFCSTIIPTVGRESLTKAVESVLRQKLAHERFEVIVVNDSGAPLPKARWQLADQVQIINTVQRERSVARNTGAAIAKGRYLHFLDDDDWLAPGAFKHFWTLSQTNQAKWLYGNTQIVDRELVPNIRLHHHLEGNCFVQFMAGEWIPLQASFIDAQTFFEVGGFNPLLAGPEDIDLLRRISLMGEVAETDHIVAHVVRGETGSTTDYGKHQKASRWAREIILERSHVFSRLRSSAGTPAWKGRMARIYLTSVVQNLWQRRLLTAASRLCFGLLSMLLAGAGALSKDYWKAVLNPYDSETHQRGIQEFAAFLDQSPEELLRLSQNSIQSEQ